MPPGGPSLCSRFLSGGASALRYTVNADGMKEAMMARQIPAAASMVKIRPFTRHSPFPV